MLSASFFLRILLHKYAGMHNPQVFCLSREKCIRGYVLSPTVISSGDLQHAKTLSLHVLLAENTEPNPETLFQ